MSEHDELSYFGEFVKGTCQLMCPDKERILRERERLLHSLELAEDDIPDYDAVQNRRKRNSKGYRADPNKTVKCFSRSAAGQKAPSPSLLRPAPVLLKTVDYLIHRVACEGIEKVQWVERYNFVADRLRAVRQDMVVQGLSSEDSIQILELMVKFHVFAAYWLCECPVSTFDSTINKTFILECLKRLLVMYDYRTKKHASRNSADRFQTTSEDSSKICSKGEFCKSEEHLMEALYLVVNLGNSDALNRSLIHRSAAECHNCIQEKVMKISLAWQCGNYVLVCRALKLLPPLLSMATVLHLPVIHRHALMVMSSAYSSKASQVPLKYLQHILAWTSFRDVKSECSHYGIQCHEYDGETVINFQKGKFNVNAKVYPFLRAPWLDSHLTTEVLHRLLSSPA